MTPDGGGDGGFFSFSFLTTHCSLQINNNSTTKGIRPFVWHISDKNFKNYYHSLLWQLFQRDLSAQNTLSISSEQWPTHYFRKSKANPSNDSKSCILFIRSRFLLLRQFTVAFLPQVAQATCVLTNSIYCRTHLS